MTYEALALQKTPIVTFGYMIQVLLSLAVVLGLIYLMAKYVLPRLHVQGLSKTIKIIDRIGIEPQVTAYHLKAGNFIYFVLVSNKNATLLDKFKEGELG